MGRTGSPFLEPVVDVETVAGQLLLSCGDDVIRPSIIRWKAWEATATRYLRQTLRLGDTFVDVGAHVGYFSVLAAKLVGPTGLVIAVEPEARNLDLLYRNLERNRCDSAHVIAAAAGANSVTVRLALDEANRGAHRVVRQDDPDAQVEVPCVRLDEELPEKVDFVKIDAQGYDHEIVAGLSGTIAANPQLRLMVELSKPELARRGIDPAFVLESYVAQDFVFSAFDTSGWFGEKSSAEVLSVLDVRHTDDELNLILDRPLASPFRPGSRPGRADELEVDHAQTGAVILDHALRRTHSLNESASVVFDLCTGQRSPGAIVEAVQSIYDLDAPPADEVLSCLDQLRRKNLLTDAAS